MTITASMSQIKKGQSTVQLQQGEQVVASRRAGGLLGARTRNLDRSQHNVDDIHSNNPYFSVSKLSKEIGVSELIAKLCTTIGILSVPLPCNEPGDALNMYA